MSNTIQFFHYEHTAPLLDAPQRGRKRLRLDPLKEATKKHIVHFKVSDPFSTQTSTGITDTIHPQPTIKIIQEDGRSYKKKRTELRETARAVASLMERKASRYLQSKVLIGRGSYAEVYQGEDRETGALVAMKVSKRSFRHDLRREAGFLQLVKGLPHCVDLRDVFERNNESHKEKQTVIVTELLRPDNLYKSYLAPHAPHGPVPNHLFRAIARQLFEALDRLKQQAHVIHGDIKSQNIIVTDDGQLKLFDFGLSVREGAVPETLIQSSPERCPEVILNGPIDCSADLWSAACTLFEIFTGSMLFPIADNPEDFDMSSNIHLQMIVDQLGPMPPAFLAKCRDWQKYFLPDGRFKRPINRRFAHFEFLVIAAAKIRGFSAEETSQILDLFRGMLRYENRASPSELLASPFFQEDIRFHLAGDFLPKDRITIYSNAAMTMHEQNPSVFPFPQPELVHEKSENVTPVCLHMRRDLSGYRVVVKSKENYHFTRACLIGEGQTLSFQFVREQAVEVPLVTYISTPILLPSQEHSENSIADALVSLGSVQ